MTRIGCLVILLALPLPAAANTLGCGGNAYSYAEIDQEPRGPRGRGPIIVLPQTLCAELIDRPRPRIRDLDVDLLLGDEPPPFEWAPEPDEWLLPPH